MNFLNSKSLNLFISTAEFSGDIYTAEIIRELRSLSGKHQLDLEVWGMGGNKVEAESVDLIQNSSELGVDGIVDVIKNLFFFLDLERRLVLEIEKRQPDVALLVDYPGLNLRLAEKIKKYAPNCRVVYFVAPQVWAWGKKRLYKIPKIVDRLLPILPFEEKLHLDVGTSAYYPGNPSAYYLQRVSEKEVSSFQANLPAPKRSSRLIGLFPGSSDKSVDTLLEIFLKGAAELSRQLPEENLHFILIQAENVDSRRFSKHLQKGLLDSSKLTIVGSKHSHAAIKSIEIAWLMSGTVTLEAACAGIPAIIGNKQERNPIIAELIARLIKVKRWGLPNIIADYDIYPELINSQCSTENFVSITKDLLQSPQKKSAMLESIETHLYPKLGQMNNSPFKVIAEEILDQYQRV